MQLKMENETQDLQEKNISKLDRFSSFALQKAGQNQTNRLVQQVRFRGISKSFQQGFREENPNRAFS